MFDDGTKIALCAVVGAAWILSMASEQYGPPPALATAVETARLPPLPLSSTPDGAPAQTPVTEMQVQLGDGAGTQRRRSRRRLNRPSPSA